MPRITLQTLTLTPVDNQQVAIRVTYTAMFSPVELFMAKNGMSFGEHINVVGVDPLRPPIPAPGPGALPATPVIPLPPPYSEKLLHNFPMEHFAPKETNVSRVRTMTVSRASLQEDPAFGDADEIRAHIMLDPMMPTRATVHTPIVTLRG